ncbi:hypothetical protein Tco_0564689 [Tanacetum coccineum]
MLAPGNYAQWYSRFMRYVDTKPNKDQLRKCIEKGPYILTQLVTPKVPGDSDEPGQPRMVREEAYVNTTPENKKLIDVKAEAIRMILNGIGNDIYLTVDACPTAWEMSLAIECLQQGKSINIQDVKTNNNDIMAASSKERPPMLASGDSDEPGQPRMVREEAYVNTTPENKKLIDVKAEAIRMILNGIGNDIYLTVDACPTAWEMSLAIECLQQGKSINIQDVKTKLKNEMVRNKLKVDTMQVNVQFLQQLQPEWSRFVTVVKKQQDLDTFSFHKLFDILKQHRMKNKGKEIVKPPSPLSESASEEDNNQEQAQTDKQLLIVIVKVDTYLGGASRNFVCSHDGLKDLCYGRHVFGALLSILRLWVETIIGCWIVCGEIYPYLDVAPPGCGCSHGWHNSVFTAMAGLIPIYLVLHSHHVAPISRDLRASVRVAYQVVLALLWDLHIATDVVIVITTGSILVTPGSVLVTPGSVITTGSILVTPGSVIVITAGSILVTPGSVITTGSILVTPGSVITTVVY